MRRVGLTHPAASLPIPEEKQSLKDGDKWMGKYASLLMSSATTLTTSNNQNEHPNKRTNKTSPHGCGFNPNSGRRNNLLQPWRLEKVGIRRKGNAPRFLGAFFNQNETGAQRLTKARRRRTLNKTAMLSGVALSAVLYIWRLIYDAKKNIYISS